MMSREDMLQELELLPVWEQRNPHASLSRPQSLKSASPVAKEVEPKALSEVVAPELQQKTEVSKPTFRLIVSEDKHWLFVLEVQHDADAELLLQNMLKAVAINVVHDIADASMHHLNQHAPKVIVVMGEVEAQQLLNDRQPLAQLRGKSHLLQHTPVVATYSPSHLLSNLPDKAKAWEDLCLAKFTIANL